MSCPCHSGQPYATCCKPLHDAFERTGAVLASSPEHLMRSRYAAYAMGLSAYIQHTTDNTGPAWEKNRAAWSGDIHAFSASHVFAGLRILEAHEGQVRFHAGIWTHQGDDVSFEETSLFVFRDGHWLYRAGTALARPFE